MRKSQSLILLCIVFAAGCSAQAWTNCNETYAIEQFQLKNSTGVFPDYTSDPYQDTDPDYLDLVDLNLLNNYTFCGLKYTDTSRMNYELKSFDSLDELLDNSFNVTHKGKCGVCSTTQDLAVYLSMDLTRPVRQCGVQYSYSQTENLKCLLDLGFTYPCAQIWLYNTLNTRKYCYAVCMASYISNQPYIINGKLNKCLQCDEDISGPIFKYESGRTRRNSGIESEIQRPNDQIYPMTHCYY